MPCPMDRAKSLASPLLLPPRVCSWQAQTLCVASRRLQGPLCFSAAGEQRQEEEGRSLWKCVRAESHGACSDACAVARAVSERGCILRGQPTSGQKHLVSLLRRSVAKCCFTAASQKNFLAHYATSFRCPSWASAVRYCRGWLPLPHCFFRQHLNVAEKTHAFRYVQQRHAQYVTCLFPTIPPFCRRLPRRRPSTSPPPPPFVPPASVSTRMLLSPPSQPSQSPPRRALAVPPSRYAFFDAA
jgi:hypothetical protein